ncbi:MAG: hypothetical protein WCL00_03305 [Bacteroidota bacterium]
MKSLKIILFFAIFFGFYNLTNGQTSQGTPFRLATLDDTLKNESNNSAPSLIGFQHHHISTNLQIGTYFSTSPGYGSSIGSYISPSFSYPVSKRFRINAGITIVNTQLLDIKPFFNAEQGGSYNGNFTNAIVFAGGDFLVNDRLKISGMVYKELNLMSTVQKPGYPVNNNLQGGYMKVDYKVFDNFHIEAGVGYSKGNYPRNYFPGTGSMNNGSPFSPDPFYHPFGF